MPEKNVSLPVLGEPELKKLSPTPFNGVPICQLVCFCLECGSQNVVFGPVAMALPRELLELVRNANSH